MQQQRLIERISDPGQQKIETIKIGRTEIAFHLLEYRGVVLDVVGTTNDAADIITHAITRTPKNLRCHIQRINLYITTKDEERLYGALLDLFIILADQGYPLRSRMLKLSRSALSEEHYDVLNQHLKSGLTASKGIVFSQASVFSNKLTPEFQLIKRIKAGSTPVDHDPIELACDHLEYGQVDSARKVLEAAIEKGVDRNDIYQELLEIYRCTKDQERYQIIHDQLEVKKHPFFARWAELADSFGVEH
jgi:hypothetical protein